MEGCLIICVIYICRLLCREGGVSEKGIGVGLLFIKININFE